MMCWEDVSGRRLKIEGMKPLAVSGFGGRHSKREAQTRSRGC